MSDRSNDPAVIARRMAEPVEPATTLLAYRAGGGPAVPLGLSGGLSHLRDEQSKLFDLVCDLNRRLAHVEGVRGDIELLQVQLQALAQRLDHHEAWLTVCLSEREPSKES